MAKIIPEYPKIIPELEYSGNYQTAINKKSLKYLLLSLFFYKRVDKNNLIYLKESFSQNLHFMPLFSMTKALAHYNDYFKSENTEDKNLFIKVAEKLIETSDEFGWKHNNLLQLPGYPPKIESYSCLHNGRGLGVLIRYYQYNKSAAVINLITNILKNFETESDLGGVQRPDGVFLEYSWGNDSPVVWNGFMSALIGLYDCHLYGPKEVKSNSKNIFDKGMEKLIAYQDRLFYDGNSLKWIRYDDNKLYFADGPYMNIEIRQLQYLSNIDSRLKKSLNKMGKINLSNRKIANIYEYYYFIKKRLMK